MESTRLIAAIWRLISGSTVIRSISCDIRTEAFSIPFIRIIRVRVYASTDFLSYGGLTISFQFINCSSIGILSISKGLNCAITVSPEFYQFCPLCIPIIGHDSPA
ncbi:hypothetical protein EQO05_00500 [Methanosarcina sp. MSH10X1]|nr:hypothetical protein EQO05_00500 [Methanosarcina sp. MSH10X1]